MGNVYHHSAADCRGIQVIIRMGILNTDDMQIVFSDTPGVLKPNYKLQESMLNFSESALVDPCLSTSIILK